MPKKDDQLLKLNEFDREIFLMALAPKIFEYEQIDIEFGTFLELCRIL